MLCEICKTRQATIHIQEIVNGEKHAVHICEACARSQNLDNPILQSLNVPDMLQSLMNAAEEEGNSSDKGKSPATPLEKCQFCGWTAEQFRKTARLGCQYCYRHFADELAKRLPDLHHGMLHTGKRVPGVATDPNLPPSGRAAQLTELKHLKKCLAESIRREEYTQAAEFRDKIQTLEQTLHACEEVS